MNFNVNPSFLYAMGMASVIAGLILTGVALVWEFMQ